MIKENRLPFYARAALFLVGLYALFAMLYIARGIIVPLVFATILAILLQPVVVLLVRFKIKRIIAIILTLLLTIIILLGLGSLIISQGVRFTESWPLLVDKFNGTLDQTIVWASGYFDIEPKTITDWIAKSKTEFINVLSRSIGQSLFIIGSGVVILFFRMHNIYPMALSGYSMMNLYEDTSVQIHYKK